jgi:hypothetical protein
LFGLRLLPHLSTTYLGNRQDPADVYAFAWFLAWWPYALTHHLNPIVPRILWAPTGISLARATSVPAPALAAWPITRLFGPVVAYDILMLSAPALAAWSAFVLCRLLTRRFWPSLLGGYLFGFSTYELAHMTGHLNLALVFLLPLAPWLVLKFIGGALGSKAFMALLTGLLVLQFLISPEVFATMTLFGAVALLLGAAAAHASTRRRLAHAAGRIAVAYGVALFVLTPLIAAFIHSGWHRVNPGALSLYSADLANLVIPTRLTLVGGSLSSPVAGHFIGNAAETDAYLGLPLVVMALLFVFSARRSRPGRILIGTLGAFVVASLGPVLLIAGKPTASLPWRAVLPAPIIGYAQPARFVVYVFLVLAVMAAIWLASARTGRRAAVRWSLAGLCVVSLLPNVAASYWRGQVQEPVFFADGLYRRYLAPDETILILPVTRRGAASVLWQANADMYFRLADGYVGCQVPAAAKRWPIVQTLFDDRLIPNAPRQWAAFLAAHRIQAVIVAGDQQSLALAQSLFEPLGVTARILGGVALYRTPTRWLNEHPAPSRGLVHASMCGPNS